MPDAEIRRRIDTVRDLLVDRGPDPKSQVEQITLALIYKLMEEWDSENERLGEKQRIFSGDFARYGWDRLVAPEISGYEMLHLYSEAIAQVPKNPEIPTPFRYIFDFDDVSLLLRDPDILRETLKLIDEFNLEQLGGAFEYLLSVLGTQGDAGQFWTPRHIIDFIVSVIDPKENEVILDPACGTAGYLISAYKHILGTSTNAKDSYTSTADSKRNTVGLESNFSGYDVSQDMVRISLANMCLHGFREPRINTYDTLTNQERWNERADVILATPPFMSPKGGIKAHERFSVKSRRAEVLFVDYIAQHLTSTGRAGIIVPEGIVFQEQRSHRQLRKMLVEDSLVAVVSLPAGVFSPYSGIKTSVLILDRVLAKRTDSIAFFKVENDGFDLSAQRRPVDQNDLPQVRAELTEFLRFLRVGESLDDLPLTMGLVVAKERIAEDGEYNLSRSRYQEDEFRDDGFPFVSLGDTSLFQIIDGGTPKSDIQEYWNGPIPWVTLADLPPDEIVSTIESTQRTISELGLENSSTRLLPENTILVSARTPIGRIGISKVPLVTNQNFKNIVIQDEARVIPAYVSLAITKLVPVMDAWAGGAIVKRLSTSRFGQLRIPLPPLEVQKRLVKEVESYQKIIEGARSVVENYRPYIAFDPEWPVAAIETVASVENGFRIPPAFQGNTDGDIPLLKASDIHFAGNEMQIVSWSNSISSEVMSELKAKSFPSGTIIFPRIGTALAANKIRILSCESTFDNSVMGIVPRTDKLLPHFLHNWLLGIDMSNWVSDNPLPSIRRKVVERHIIPLPPLSDQHSILQDLEAEHALVEASRMLIQRFQDKIPLVVSRIWENEQTTYLKA